MEVIANFFFLNLFLKFNTYTKIKKMNFNISIPKNGRDNDNKPFNPLLHNVEKWPNIL